MYHYKTKHYTVQAETWLEILMSHTLALDKNHQFILYP